MWVRSTATSPLAQQVKQIRLGLVFFQPRKGFSSIRNFFSIQKVFFQHPDFFEHLKFKRRRLKPDVRDSPEYPGAHIDMADI